MLVGIKLKLLGQGGGGAVPITRAAEQGHVDAVEALVRVGCNVQLLPWSRWVESATNFCS